MAWVNPGQVRLFDSVQDAETFCNKARFDQVPVVAVVFAQGCSHCVTLKPIVARISEEPEFATPGLGQVRFLGIEYQHASAWFTRFALKGLPTVLAFGKRGNNFVHHLPHGREDILRQDVRRLRDFEHTLLPTQGRWEELASHTMLNPIVRTLMAERFCKIRNIVHLHRSLGEYGFVRHMTEESAFRQNVMQVPAAMQGHAGKVSTRDEALMIHAKMRVVQAVTGQAKSRRRKNLTVGRWFYRRLQAGDATSLAALLQPERT
jgi:thiol-disulfide isomerase/thioredoxin